ncbi:MAG TPA: class I SAM-dependent methyltransferase, partial [Chloroflexota bacterium]|nr:class I SAM-dependent methyltransferase [Chloroflexota bacterium]
MESLDADFDAETSAEIASLAQRRGWQVAAHDRMRALDDRAYRLAIDEYAAGLRVLLPLTEESRVLVLRCGWGAVALGLAECTDHVVAVDDRESRLRFLAARREQARTATLQIVQGCLTSGLPFGGEAFDAAILLDTIERVPGRDQAAALVAVRRVLVPGGSLLLGVPNRIGIV